MSINAGADCASRHVQSGDEIQLGKLVLRVIDTPGHTNGCISFYVPANKMVFTGDALLIRGCGRTDFQQGSAARLYDSIHQNIFELPDETLIYPGHDYHGRTVTSVREEKQHNPRLGGGKSKSEFKAIMRGLKLGYPQNGRGRPCQSPMWIAIKNTVSKHSLSFLPTQWTVEPPFIAEVGYLRWPTPGSKKFCASSCGCERGLRAFGMPPIPDAIHSPQPVSNRPGCCPNPKAQSWCVSLAAVLRACDLLAQHGFEHVASMAGGMLAGTSRVVLVGKGFTPSLSKIDG